MFRNIAKKEDYKELQKINNVLNTFVYRIEFDPQPIMIIDYEENPEDPENPTPTGQHEDPDRISFMQHTFNYKPSLNEIKNLIFSYYNNQVDGQILEGFSWTSTVDPEVTITPYLSMENQMNYKIAFDRAVATSGESLPYRILYGKSSIDTNYYDFTVLSDFTDFYSKYTKYIEDTLASSRSTKDSIDWSKYVIEDDDEVSNTIEETNTTEED